MKSEELLAYAREKSIHSSGPLREWREIHLGQLETKGLQLTEEGYKFTPMLKFMQQLELGAANTGTVKTPLASDAITLIDGKVSSSLPVISGVGFYQLKDRTDLLGKVLKTAAPLSHLHHSLLEDGLVIEVTKNCHLNSPLKINHHHTAGVTAPLVIIIGSAFSEFTILEETTGHAQTVAVSETYLLLENGARVDHIQLNSGDARGLQHGSTYAEVERDASYRNFIFHVSGGLNRRNLEIKMLSPGANGESYCLYLTADSEHSDINTVLEHVAADTTSNQLAKGILDGQSRGVFTGKIHIHPGAQRVASAQLNKNLILSRKAQANSQPQLEIFADDVKCSHGSTTGQLSPDELFYFEARGIPENRARILLAHAFGLEVVLRINNPVARERISAVIMSALKTKFKLGGDQ
jgi:Fe-S cluster assembly protein SufD